MNLLSLQHAADSLYERQIELVREIMDMSETENMKQENAIRLLTIQQDKMYQDIKEMREMLAEMARSVAVFNSQHSVLEQKYIDSQDAIKRAHSRSDKLEELIKDEFKGHEKRLQQIEIHNAKNIWIERIIGLIVAGVIAMWVKGGL